MSQILSVPHCRDMIEMMIEELTCGDALGIAMTNDTNYGGLKEWPRYVYSFGGP